MKTYSDYASCIPELQNGLIGIIRCDTLWGIVGIMSSNVAHKIIVKKKRSASQGFIVLSDSMASASKLIQPISSKQSDYMNQVWPGPTTLILKKAPHIDGSITGYRDTIGIRVPNYTPLVKMLGDLNAPLISTSANISGASYATSHTTIPTELLQSMDFICTMDDTHPHIESTIVDITSPDFKILRTPTPAST